MIQSDDIQKIKDASRIEEVVGDFVSLKKRGINLIGLCPFHNEKTPSFNVNPARGIFKCFGCGKGGDSVSFLMEHEHFSYPEALRYLAQKYNVPIQEKDALPEDKQRQNERDALFHITDFAHKHFVSMLFENTDGRNIGLSYLKERNLTEATIQKWGLGFALESWDNLTKEAVKNGYSQDVLVKSGLSILNEEKGSVYDRFRNRVMFPIRSEGGRILGFTGRTLSNISSQAKYVNSPESEIYHKSRTLFGIYHAKSAILKNDLCYLVEGNVDVITLSQNGLENVVASSGTSLTAEQIRLVKRYTKNITILYDGDKAGIKAALRATDLLLEQEMNVRIVLFPDGEDPDSYARKVSQTELHDFIQKQAQNFILFKTNLLLEDANDPIKRAELIKEVLRTIALLPNNIDRETYLRECSSCLKIEENTLRTEFHKILRVKTQKDLKKQQQESEIEIPPVLPSVQPQEDFQPKTISCDAQEQKIASLLIKYGNHPTTQYFYDEQGNKHPQSYPVSHFLVSDLINDNISFTNPVYDAILILFKQNITEQESELSPEALINHPEEAVRNFVTEILAKEDNISPLWASKWGVRTPLPSEQSIIDQDVKESLVNFKLKKVEARRLEIRQILKETSSEKEIKEIILEQQQLDSIRSFLALELRRTVTH